MPYRPDKAKEILATTEIEFEDESVSVTYRKKLVQTACVNIFEGTQQQQALNMRGAIEDLVVAWDVLDADEQPLPATQDVTRHFEFEFLVAVINGIVAHALPGEAGGATSQATSPKTVPSARAQKNT